MQTQPNPQPDPAKYQAMLASISTDAHYRPFCRGNFIEALTCGDDNRLDQALIYFRVRDHERAGALLAELADDYWLAQQREQAHHLTKGLPS